MADNSLQNRSKTFPVREAIGVFADADALEAAVTEFERAGFARTAMSVLGSGSKGRDSIADLYHTAAEMAEKGLIARTNLTGGGAEAEEQNEASHIPVYIGGIAGAVAVAASGGALALAIAGMIAGGVAGAGIGALLSRVIAHHHAETVEQQLALGGLVLWVDVADANTEKAALAILEQAKAANVHVHEVARG